MYNLRQKIDKTTKQKKIKSSFSLSTWRTIRKQKQFLKKEINLNTDLFLQSIS